MPTAYVLVTCELGSEKEIINQLKNIEGVKETHGTFGVYDILVKVELENVEKVQEIITMKIKKLSNIHSTLILMGTGDQN